MVNQSPRCGARQLQCEARDQLIVCVLSDIRVGRCILWVRREAVWARAKYDAAAVAAAARGREMLLRKGESFELIMFFVYGLINLINHHSIVERGGIIDGP